MSISQQFTVLKTLESTSIPELLEDLNYNFAQLLNVYAVKGLKGDIGGTGQGGSGGVRGASFMILDIEKFEANFSSPADPQEINLDTINDAVVQNAILFFKECTNFDDIVHNDMLILPNGYVIQYNSITGLFHETRLRLYNTTDTWTQEQIIQLIEEYSQNGDGLYKPYTAKNKIIADDAPNAEIINSVFNPNAVADIGTTDSGAGFESRSMQFIALQETAGIIDDNRVQLSVIDGHTVDYHELAQNTIASGMLNSVPKSDALPVNILLQNQHNSGFIFGSPSLDTLNKFGHIRKTAEALDIMPYYTNDGTFIASNTILSMTQSSITGRAKNIILNSYDTAIDMQVGATSKIKVENEKSTVFNKLFIDSIKQTNQSIVSVLPTGEAVSVPYKTTGTLDSTGNALPIESLIYKFVVDHVNSRLGWATNETVKFYLDALTTSISTVNTNLATLNLIAGAFKGPKGAVLAYRGAVIPQGWAIVDDLKGRMVVGMDANDVEFYFLGKRGGKKTHVQTVAQLARHKHTWFGLSGRSISAAQGRLRNAVEDTTHETSEVGNNEPMPIMNPYETVHFIEFTG